MKRIHAPHVTARLLAPLAALLIVGLSAWLWPAGYATFDARLSDLGWALAARDTPPEKRIVVLDIDEQSLDTLGPWPWPRERLATIARLLEAKGAAYQIYDIVLDEERPDDDALSAALPAQKTALAQVLAIQQGAAIMRGHLDDAGALDDCPTPFPVAHGWRAPAATLARHPQGHITPRIDPDGIIRAQPAYACAGGRARPALTLAAYLRLSGADAPRIEPGEGLLAPAWRINHPMLPTPIPLDRNGDLHIPYRIAREGILAISAADLLAGRIPDEAIAGRIILIGSSAFSLGDVVSTPLAGADAGVSVHHQLLTALLDERIPYTPRGAALLAGALALLAALLLTGLAFIQRPMRRALPLAGLGLAALLTGLHIVLQLQHDLLLGLSAPALVALMTGLALGAAELARADAEGARLWAHLAAYLPAPVAQRLLRAAPRPTPTLERRDISVLHADLRNFSAWSEACPPEQVAAILHTFLHTAENVITAHGGLIEAIEGDAVLCVWNGSAPCLDHPERALASARELLARVEARLPAPHDDLPPLALGLGLDSGPALVGSLGSARRRHHSVLGLPVTRAVRLQAMTADLAWPILIGPGLAERLPAGQLRSQGEFLLEGLRRPCIVYAAP